MDDGTDTPDTTDVAPADRAERPASPSAWAAERFTAPAGAQRLRELRSPLEPFRLAVRARTVRAAPRGDGRALVAFPGYGAGDTSLLPVRTFLASRDHGARGWGLGVNRADADDLLPRCVDVVRQLVASTGRAVNLLGWSLGGVYAREVARDHPDLVHRLATMATPIYGPRYTLTRRVYSDDQLARIDGHIDARFERPIRRPLLAIHSPNDGVVDWRSCIDDHTPGARNLMVSSTHLAMGIDPDVWRALGDWFAADADA